MRMIRFTANDSVLWRLIMRWPVTPILLNLLAWHVANNGTSHTNPKRQRGNVLRENKSSHRRLSLRERALFRRAKGDNRFRAVP